MKDQFNRLPEKNEEELDVNKLGPEMEASLRELDDLMALVSLPEEERRKIRKSIRIRGAQIMKSGQSNEEALKKIIDLTREQISLLRYKKEGGKIQ